MAYDSIPDAIDVHVGARVRLLRKRAGVSQEGLGDKIGVTFQQVQKYERGSNRLSASAMLRAAVALGTTVDSFYVGLPEAAVVGMECQADERARLFANSPMGVAMATAFEKLSPTHQALILGVAAELAAASGARE